MTDSGIDLGLLKPILKTPSLCELLLQNSLPDVPVSRQSSPGIEAVKSRSPLSWKTLEKVNTYPASTLSRASSTRDKNVRFHEEVSQCVSIIKATTAVDEGYITCDPSCDTDCDVVGLVRGCSPRSPESDTVRTIELLPPTRLKAEGQRKPDAVQRSISWRSRTLSYSWNEDNLPAPSTRLADSEEMDWISPIAKEPSKSQLLDRIPMLTDEELFEIEMFGSIQHGLKAERSPFSLPAEDPEAQSSPGMSEYLDSGSDDLDDEDYISLQTQATAMGRRCSSPSQSSDPNQSLAQRLLDSNDLNPFEDGDLLNYKYESASFSFHSKKDLNKSSKLPSPPRFQPFSSPATQKPNPSAALHTSRFELSGMGDEDEDHWWMNV